MRLEEHAQIFEPQLHFLARNTFNELNIASQKLSHAKSDEDILTVLNDLLMRQPYFLKVSYLPRENYTEDALHNMASKHRKNSVFENEKTQNYTTDVLRELLQQKNREHIISTNLLNNARGFSQAPQIMLTHILYKVRDSKTFSEMGSLLLHIDYNQFMNTALSNITTAIDLLLINTSGHYYVYSQSAKNIFHEGNLNDPDANTPETTTLKDIYTHKDRVGFITGKLGIDEHIFYFKKIFFTPDEQNPFLISIATMNSTSLLSDAYKLIFLNIISFMFFSAAAIIFCFAYTHYFKNKLRHIIKAIDDYNIGGAQALQLPSDRNDEIGQLATSFEFLTKKLELVTNAEKQMHTRMQAILDNTVDGIITINDKGIIIHYNKACKHIFGYTQEEAIGQNVKFLMPDPYKSEHDQYIKNYKETGKRKIIGIGREVMGRRKDGSTFPMELSVGEVKVGGNCFYSGIVRDITERKNAETEIIRSNEELERFAYVASHDLQEPLRMVKNFTSLLEKKYAAKLDDTAKEYISIAHTSAVRMQDLVTDLLEYARIGNGNYIIEEVDTNEVMKTIQQNLANSISSSKAQITYDNLPKLKTNRLYFILVLQNLISNSIKYQKPDTKPQIHISVQDNDDHWSFKVTDNGIGMKQEYCDKIFEPFKRLHAKNEYSGTGMGLSICRKILDGLGGKISATSEPDKGSVFDFSIPKEIHREEQSPTED